MEVMFLLLMIIIKIILRKGNSKLYRIEYIQFKDKIYINDFLTQKMYTYTVVSNNDIRYDYETNVIQFPAGSEELVIGTCWPPGSTAAERYVHCKLSSVDSLN